MMQATSTPSRVTRARLDERLAPPPLGLALLGEGADALAEVLGGKAGPAQLDELPFGFRVELRGAGDLVDRPLVTGHRKRRVGRDLGGELDRGVLEPVPRDDLVDEADALGARRGQVAAGEEELARERDAHDVDEALEAGV